jgi:hypothetical protein
VVVPDDRDLSRALGELQVKAAAVERCHREWVASPDDDDLRAAFEAAWRSYEVAHQQCLRLPPLRDIES